MLYLLLSLSGVFIATGTLYWIILKERKKNKYSPFTEPSLRSPGYELGREIDAQTDKLLLPYLAIAVSPFVYFTLSKELNTWAKIAIAIPLVIAIAWGIRRFILLFNLGRRIRLGLDGEVYTGQELNFLMRHGAWVYHDIPYTYGNIDHIVISTGGVFVIETKAVRKPSDKEGKRQSTVQFRNETLHFPHGSSDKPILQSRVHAKYIKDFLYKITGKHYPVIPIIAIPGWFIDTSAANSNVLVINPRNRCKALQSFVKDYKISKEEVEIVANHIDSLARTVNSSIDMTDPDGGKNYSLLFNRKNKERRF